MTTMKSHKIIRVVIGILHTQTHPNQGAVNVMPIRQVCYTNAQSIVALYYRLADAYTQLFTNA